MQNNWRFSPAWQLNSQTTVNATTASGWDAKLTRWAGIEGHAEQQPAGMPVASEASWNPDCASRRTWRRRWARARPRPTGCGSPAIAAAAPPRASRGCPRCSSRRSSCPARQRVEQRRVVANGLHEAASSNAASSSTDTAVAPLPRTAPPPLQPTPPQRHFHQRCLVVSGLDIEVAS